MGLDPYDMEEMNQVLTELVEKYNRDIRPFGPIIVGRCP